MRSLRMRFAARRALLGLGAAAAAGLGLPAGADDEATAGVLEDVIVVGRQRSAADEILEERMEAEVVADRIGIEQISRVGDSTVSLALRRLPGVTLVADQFIYIRGLGERYSSTTVNGAYVPSPDLTRNVIPLDLFPAEIVDSISIRKGYSADQPAAFGGGNVDIRTRGLPEGFVFNIEVGTGFNSESSDDGLSYPGGDEDFWGTDDGARALPAAITQAIGDYRGNPSQTGIFDTLVHDGQFHSFAEAQAINRGLATSLNRDLEFSERNNDPDKSVEVSLGNRWDFGDEGQWRFGVLALGDYQNQWRNRERTIRSVTTPDEDFDLQRRTTNQVALTGSLGIGLDFAEEQHVEATAIFLRNTEDEASLTLGHNFNFRRESGQQLRNYRIRYEQRELELYQLRGSHRLGAETIRLIGDRFDLGWPDFLDFVQDLSFDWYYSDATATTDIPGEVLFSAQDTIDPASGELLVTSIRSSLSAAEFRFTELEDEATSYGTRITLPVRLGRVTLELGGGYDYYEKGRGYLQTQLGLGTTAAAALPILSGTPGQVFTDEHIVDPLNGFALSIGGIGTESYLAGETVDAAWGKVELSWDERWRVSAGLRWEDFQRISVPVDPLQFDGAIGKILVPLDELESLVASGDDYHPSLAVTWIRPGFWAENFQLRFGWSQTVARPDLREISGATYIDPLTEARVRGNPTLRNSDLGNFDLRAEWFFAAGDNLTVSLFYKDIQDPIETVEAAGTDDNIALTFINAASAELYGAEIEGLKGLGFLSGGGWTDAFFLSGNLTISDSRLRIGDAAPNLTHDRRRLTQHSKYLANLQLGYDSPDGRHSASLAYNVYGERIFFAGRNGAADAYEQPFNSLDLTYSFQPTERFRLKLRLQNLLDTETSIEQGGVTVLEQNLGTTAKVDFSYRF